MFGLFKKKQEPSRKERSEKILKEKGIKINYNLPNIEAEEDTVIRTPKEIAERVLVLAITNAVAFNGITEEQAYSFFEKAGLLSLVTPKERDFLENPTEEKKSAETWKCEGIWVLMWALNIVDDLGFPEALCDLKNIPSDKYPIGGSVNPKDFIANMKSSRTKIEIMDANDLYYRLDWACVDARINQKEMTDMNPGVVYERHYALNWLVNYMEQDWDDISCDT